MAQKLTRPVVAKTCVLLKPVALRDAVFATANFTSEIVIKQDISDSTRFRIGLDGEILTI